MSGNKTVASLVGIPSAHLSVRKRALRADQRTQVDVVLTPERLARQRKYFGHPIS